jgi:uncharacterized protein YecE (DUF72 family)
VDRDPVFIGTAGWSVPTNVTGAFPDGAGGLERYAAWFGCAEINSSFHRSHRASTWHRWAASVPAGFRFSAKLSKEVTHRQRLAECSEPLERSIGEMRLLGEKLAVVLVQLPPSLAFERTTAERFLVALRALWPGAVAFEPRHPSWFASEPETLLDSFKAARVAADPPRVPEAAQPGGWGGLRYWRLHGSPVAYRSSYDDGRIEGYAARIAAERAEGRPVWCIFDNTASSAAAGDALKLVRLLEA